jgi:hypothetical protein
VTLTETWQITSLKKIVPGTQSYSWKALPTTDVFDITYVKAGWLKNPSSMPSDTLDLLTRSGITSADYPNILAADPLATGSSATAPRYQSAGWVVPYNPLDLAGDPNPTEKLTVTSDNVTTSETGTTKDATLTISESLQPGIPGFASAELKSTQSWEFEHSSSNEQSSEFSSSADVTIASPSAGYTGPPQIAILWDSVFHTFVMEPYKNR